jgi:cytochrome P450
MPPEPQGSRLFGSLFELRRDLLGANLRAMRECGDVVRFVAGPPGLRLAIYGVYHPDGVQQVLATGSARYGKGDTFYDEVRWALGNGIVTTEGERWRRQKRYIQPLFTHRQVAGYVPLIAREVTGLLDRWRQVAAGAGVVDLHGEMTRLTLRVVGSVLFGADVEEVIPVIRRAFPILSERILRRSLSPVRIPSTWPTPANRRDAAARQALYGVCDELISRRQAEPLGGSDLLSLLVEVRDAESGQPLDDAEIRDQVLIFLLAGHETTATALTFVLHLLGRHPDVQQRVQEEVEGVLGGRPPTFEHVAALAYTTMVVKEATRLYPPVFGIARLSQEADVVMGYEIPPRSTVVTSPWATHRHPAFWDDPERFEPERFAPEREALRHPYAYFPFGGGPRGCIGEYFSVLEAVVATAMVLQAFSLTSPPGPVPLATRITLCPASAVPCQLIPR